MKNSIIKVGVINITELMLNQRKFTTSEISRGTGIHKSKKQYNRNAKYKKKISETN